MKTAMSRDQTLKNPDSPVPFQTPIEAPTPSRANASTSAAAENPIAAEEESESESQWESDTSEDDSSSSSEMEGEAEEGDEQNQRNRDSVQPAEARRVDSDGVTEALTFTLTNPNVLDCPICFEPLRSPIYQCENGHIACLPCCTKMAKKCPSCRLPIHIRSRAIEMILESLQTKCRNMMYGCMEKLHYSKRSGHESTCIYAPCSCPEIDCDYVGMSKCLYTHFASQHPQHSTKFGFNTIKAIYLYAGSKHAFLVEEKDNILFILNRSIESVGSFVNIVCVAPATTKREYLYGLTARDAQWNSSVILKTHVECVPKWRPGDPSKVCLFVPRDFERLGGMLLLEITIRRH